MPAATQRVYMYLRAKLSLRNFGIVGVVITASSTIYSTAVVTSPLTPSPRPMPPRLQDPDSQFSRLLASERRQSSPSDVVDVETRDAAPGDDRESADLVGVRGGGEGTDSAKAEEGTVWVAGDSPPPSQ